MGRRGNPYDNAKAESFTGARTPGAEDYPTSMAVGHCAGFSMSQAMAACVSSCI